MSGKSFQVRREAAEFQFAGDRRERQRTQDHGVEQALGEHAEERPRVQRAEPADPPDGRHRQAYQRQADQQQQVRAEELDGVLLEPEDRRLEEVRGGVDLRAEEEHSDFVHRQERQRKEQPGRERARDVEVAALRGGRSSSSCASSSGVG